MESEINYEEQIKKYSLEELEDVQERIDKEKYPERYDSVIKEIHTRSSNQKIEHPGSVKDEELPELYSVITVRVFAILFGTLAGGILLMVNIKAVSEDIRPRNKIFAYSILYTVAVAFLFVIHPVFTKLTLGLNLLGLLPLEYYFWPKYIGKDFKYRNKSFVKPLIIWVTISIILYLLYV